jgi:DNA-binding protein HU-beta
MTKKELIERLVEKEAFTTKAHAERTVNAMLEVITNALATGEKIDLYGFGKFEIVERTARTGRNPKTGEIIEIPAKNSVKFKASRTLNELIK